MMSVWHDVGYYCIILLANMQGLSAEVYESAAVDGANNIQTFFRITIPMMASSIFFCITLATINSFKIFDQVNIITEGGPGFSTTVLVQAIYYYAFKEYKIGYAAAVAIVLFVIIFIFSTVLQKLEENSHTRRLYHGISEKTSGNTYHYHDHCRDICPYVYISIFMDAFHLL